MVRTVCITLRVSGPYSKEGIVAGTLCIAGSPVHALFYVYERSYVACSARRSVVAIAGEKTAGDAELYAHQESTML